MKKTSRVVLAGLALGIVGCPASDATEPQEPAPPAAIVLPAPPAWMTDEATTFEHVRQLLIGAGFAEAAEIQTTPATEFLPAYYLYLWGLDTVTLTPMARDPAAIRDEIDATLRIFGGRMTLYSYFETAEDALEFYWVWRATAAGHEIGHHVQATRGDPADDYYANELEGVEYEVAVLEALIARGDVPERWRDLYRRGMEAGVAGVAQRARDAMPVDPAARKALFNERMAEFYQALQLAGDGGGVAAVDAIDVVSGVIWQRRLDLVADPPSFAELRGRTGPISD